MFLILGSDPYLVPSPGAQGKEGVFFDSKNRISLSFINFSSLMRPEEKF